MSYQPEHPMCPSVTTNGRRVTVAFDMPFMVGDECITPRGYEKTTVSNEPEVSIRLRLNRAEIEIHAGGAWYTASHTQMHGPSEFLPDMAAFLDYWLGQKRESFEPRIADLRRKFAGQPDALERITARLVHLLQAEADALKKHIGNDVIATAQRVTELEAAIAKATGSAA
jgi:hypothetical protein